MAREGGEVLHGVNLSGWLVLEPWVTPELFAGTGSLGEATLVAALGDELYADLVCEHREAFVTERDFEQIASRGHNAVRLPVPWYAFGGQGPNPGPYVGCIMHVDDALVWAERHGVKVLLSLAISPGAQGTGCFITSRIAPSATCASFSGTSTIISSWTCITMPG